MKKTFIAAAVIVAMVSCNKNLIENPMMDSNYGYINLGITADTEMVVTKGITASGVSDINTYNVALLVKDGEAYKPYWNSSSLTGVTVSEAGYIEYAACNTDALWTVPAGSYKVVVENLTKDEPYTDVYNETNGTVRVEGSAEITVSAGSNKNCSVECTPKNSKITFAYTDDFAKVFKTEDANFNVTLSERNISLKPSGSSNHAGAIGAYYEPTTLTWRMNVCKNDETNPKTYTSTISLKEGKWTQVTFSTGTTDGKINVQVTVNNSFGETSVTYEVDPFSTDVIEK